MKEYQEIVAPLLDDLAAASLAVQSLRELLVLGRADYLRAVPILIHWLPLIQDDRVKESIVRVLTMKAAGPLAIPTLVHEFGRSDSLELKWAIGNALSVVADDSVFSDIEWFVRNGKHGRAREMLAVALGNMKNPRAVDVLLELLDDDEVAGHAIIALGKLKAQRSKPHVERFLTHPKSWVRREAKRALRKIERAQA